MTRWLGFAILVVLLVGAPFVLSFSQQEIAVFLVINVLIVCSYRLLTLTGEWSLGHFVIVGVGGYASALLSKPTWLPPEAAAVLGGGLPVPLAMLAGGCVAALVAFVLSFPLFRLKGFYFLIGSFAAGEVIRLLWKKFRDPFGGPKGLKSVEGFPDIQLGDISLPMWDATNYYYLCLVVVGLSLWVLYRIERSRIGLTFHALHWQDKLAESVGVNAWRYRMLAFVIASFFAGLAGALMAHYLGTVNPNMFDVEPMVFVLIWVIVGGTATFYGPILGVVVLTVLNEIVLRELGVADQMRHLIYGLLLILAVLFLPKGLESGVERLRARVRRREEGDTRTVQPDAA